MSMISLTFTSVLRISKSAHGKRSYLYVSERLLHIMSFHNNVHPVISISHFCNQCSLRKTIDRPILQKLVHLYNQYSLGKTIDRSLLQKIDQEIPSLAVRIVIVEVRLYKTNITKTRNKQSSNILVI